MRDEIKTVLLSRKDLNIFNENMEFIDINCTDFSHFFNHDIYEAHFVIFVDDDGKTKIIKNRFGADGIVS